MPENKSVLLISNGNYKNFSSLATPVGEAEALGKALSDLGFQVILLKNGTREQMLEALDTFGASFKGKGGTAFFHYGGHGVQVSGKNYLIPADADIPDERKLATRAVDIEEVMITLDSSGSETNIIVLDACRNNPLPAGAGRSASRGLSVVSVKPKNSVIIYSAEAGSVAQDGLFTPALSAAIIKPGISITEVLQTVRQEVYQKSNGAQIPGEYSQLFKQVYLNDSLSHDFSNAKVALDKSFLSRLGEAVLEVPMGGYWEVVADKYNGGSSKASFDEAYLKKGFLYFDYSLAENSNIGYRYARAEANFDNNVDLSMYTKVELKVRGNNKKYWVGLNSGSVKDYGYHHSASFTSRPEWAIIKVQFRDMIQEKWAKKVAIDLKNISALQVSMSSNQSGESGWLEIEYVKLLP